MKIEEVLINLAKSRNGYYSLSSLNGKESKKLGLLKRFMLSLQTEIWHTLLYDNIRSTIFLNRTLIQKFEVNKLHCAHVQLLRRQIAFSYLLAVFGSLEGRLNSIYKFCQISSNQLCLHYLWASWPHFINQSKELLL